MLAGRVFRGGVAFAGLVALTASAASAQNTGSRLPEGDSNHPREIIRFDEPGELKKIRKLIPQGKLEEARRLARSLMNGDPSPDMQYAGLNAKCAIETHAGNIDTAIEACNRALRIRPRHWMALNSRGTVHFVAQRFEAALEDYRTALRYLPKDSNEAEIVRNNIALAERRLRGDG